MSGSMNSTDSDPEQPSFVPQPAVLAGDVLDGSAEFPAELNLQPEERERLADHFWLDALLKQVLGPSEQGHRESLIRNIMAALRREEAERPVEAAPAAETSRRARPARRVWMASLASLAAAIVLGVVLWPETAPATALATVERSLQAAAKDVDREYRIQITKANANLVPAGTLTVRGAGRYVFAQPGPIGVLRVGTNGKEYWLVPPVGPVRVAGEGSFVERMLSERQFSTPILSLTTVLQHLLDRYDLELLTDEQIPSAEDAARLVRCQHLRGRLQQEAELFAPRTIDVWCDRGTGVVQRMVMSWPAGSRSGMLQCEVTLQPIPTDLPADFYDHSAHHVAQRPVLRWPPPSRNLPEGINVPDGMKVPEGIKVPPP